MRASRSLRLAFVATVLAVSPVAAQDYPTKTVRIIVPFTPGGGNDIVARFLGKYMTEMHRQQYVVENRPGAGTIIGVDALAKSPPDGHTLMVTNNSIAVNHTLYPKLPYETLKDVTPIIKAGSTPNVLVVHPSVPVKTTKELLALLKAKPNQIAYASAGTGSTAFLAAELFKMLADVRMLHVPYKGAAPALTSILSGETQVAVTALPGAVANIKAGRLKALGVTSAHRATGMKEIPTMIEGGVKDFDFETWYGVFAPRGISRDLVNRINASVNKVLAIPEARELLMKGGIDPGGGTTEAFDKLFRDDVVTLGKVIKASGAKPET
ncbi:MAG: Bug family tripartite tricarboxylate transporter substrate binding protein [Burkholderiales bacterium]